MKGLTLGIGKLMIRCGTLLWWGWGPVNGGFIAGPSYYGWRVGCVTVLWELPLNPDPWPYYDAGTDQWIGVLKDFERGQGG